MNKIFCLRIIIGLVITFSLMTPASGQFPREHYKFSADLDSALSLDTTAYKYQMAATYYSIAGYYQKALQAWDKNGGRKPVLSKSDSLFFANSKKVDAGEYIIDRAKDERIVIINEAHHVARHRTFTASLLQGLYDEGYRYLGLETLNDSLINERKFPVNGSGFYLREPEFGNMVTQALKMGFILFGYEASGDKNGKEREIEQAQNIKNFIDHHKEGKVLIHCGYAHAYEGTYQAWEKAMAGRLKEYTGIDPLTINQETYTEKGNRALNAPFVNLLSESNPVVLIDPKGNDFLSPANGTTDIVIIHPASKYINGRPDWIMKGKSSYKFPVDKITTTPLLLLAYREGEFEKDGMPADIIEVTEKNDKQFLYLAPGKYQIIVRDRGYKVLDKIAVLIK